MTILHMNDSIRRYIRNGKPDVQTLESDLIFVNETERKPNLYASRVLAGIVGVITVVWLLNETGVFTVDKPLVQISLFTSLALYAIMRLMVRNKDLITHPVSKYVFMLIVLILVLVLTVLLNIHAILAYILPLLVATQYRSKPISALALIGSCVCCAVAPVLSYCFNTWSLVFMTGYIETFCRVTIDITMGNDMTSAYAIWQILLYWALPQVMTVAAFGLILFSVTKSGIDSVRNQMQIAELSENLKTQLKSITTMQDRAIYTMSDIMESRDTDTGGHVRRTSEIVRLIMDAMSKDKENGVTDAFCAYVIKCAPMHDLGKISIPDEILKKPGKLTREEYEIVKLHPIKSAEIIKRALTGMEDESLITVATSIAKYHHERFDGKGYPEGLKGKDIPIEARIMSIADVYDALVSERCYKAALPFDFAFETIESLMGTQFDPDLNKYFVMCRRDIERFYTTACNKRDLDMG